MYSIKKDKNKVYEKFHINVTDANIDPIQQRNCWLIEIHHEGISPLNQKNIDDLKPSILEGIKLNKEYGFIPYNNFECSIDWYQTEPK